MVLSGLLTLCLSAAPASDDIAAATRAWEEGRLKRLQAEDGWLSLVGLGWLKEGVNTAGSDGKADVVFPEGAPKSVGTFTRSGRKVSVQPATGVSVTRDGKPCAAGHPPGGTTAVPAHRPRRAHRRAHQGSGGACPEGVQGHSEVPAVRTLADRRPMGAGRSTEGDRRSQRARGDRAFALARDR